MSLFGVALSHSSDLWDYPFTRLPVRCTRRSFFDGTNDLCVRSGMEQDTVLVIS